MAEEIELDFTVEPPRHNSSVLVCVDTALVLEVKLQRQDSSAISRSPIYRDSTALCQSLCGGLC
jgi:hypothetical protein